MPFKLKFCQHQKHACIIIFVLYIHHSVREIVLLWKINSFTWILESATFYISRDLAINALIFPSLLNIFKENN